MLTPISAIFHHSQHRNMRYFPATLSRRVLERDKRRQARAPSAKDAEGVGVPLILSLVIVLADPEPPKASAGIPRRRLQRRELFAGSKPPEACAGALGEACEWAGVPLPPRYELTTKAPDASAGSLGRDLGRGRTPLPLARGTESGTAPSCAHNPESGGTALLVEGSFLLILRRGRAKEKNDAMQPTHADAPAFKIAENVLLSEMDTSPSSLSMLSRSTLMSQLSTTPINASRGDPRDVANGQSQAQSAREGEGGDERGEGCAKADLRYPLHSRFHVLDCRGELRRGVGRGEQMLVFDPEEGDFDEKGLNAKDFGGGEGGTGPPPS
ncbi:hypothetical protein EV121DRAFT_274095 [Schizophyllum commune]